MTTLKSDLKAIIEEGIEAEITALNSGIKSATQEVIKSELQAFASGMISQTTESKMNHYRTTTISNTIMPIDSDDTTIDIFEDTHDTPNLGDLPALFNVDESHSSVFPFALLFSISFFFRSK
ncbi:hypothetical protein N7519_006205 [Penicillium mononematosum]|uniref:uncharacterized protein n=1 Tax=Penicillium mononematosum TaxID=268346 RepID=UPI002547CD71|nr:uncharacterized protein N7519_006205 [Penicillium mononematosum]KAJ6184904.1 hypothetical protein N7519_006205 [Penicillium mononematosum]